MSWGKSSAKVEVRSSSTFGQLFPLIVLVLVLAGAGFVGYHIYLSVQKIQQQATDKFAKKNVVFTKDGMRVGVRHVEQEKYVDATQNWVVKAWNLSGGNNTEAEATKSTGRHAHGSTSKSRH